ncbi:Lrp/AsnC family leucine-responsive transcriptional regulator [Aquimarina sp. EL_43]|uniref:Lrp/AsnC family transcriptional regulator n=1 Tax=unclassified Aquimarina TaxID=2627091 RepID=UPI001A222E85|nr:MULTISPECIES: Lrp/AsnC family transcriptional regulator [unclassified Aquimarina]MBG6130648.1 Lrp/AsnC family leucine-responsive transcriptional regulator [Aquimarina sp. EL_35]MBG6151206.1 Lrp/AsnC family leucine-responsive transcriptional regulator [Aquimarina sp. EL_32]MBG6169050.1 Lrp/AsnC family leucine-responsive transcriptional regulator [Aquimarina sp. EL_43]
MIKDNLDLKIIQLLKKNSRFSYAQIGREIGLSSSAVGERVLRLEDTGVILSYTSELNYVKLGYSLSSYISMSFKDNQFYPFLELVGNFSEILECSRITGVHCLIMKVVVRDNYHLEQFIDILSQYGTPSTSVILSDIVTGGKVTNNKCVQL